MHSNLDLALSYIFKDEGGFAQRPEEGGGSVNMGITLVTFTQWRVAKKRQTAPTIDDLKAMSREEATEIYLYRYLDAIRFDDLQSGVDYCCADAAIHSGVVGSIRFLQEALGFRYLSEHPNWDGHPVTGEFDLDTLYALHHVSEPSRLVYELIAVRRHRQSLMLDRKAAKDPKFDRALWERVWGHRNEHVRTRAGAMLSADTGAGA